MLVTGLAGGEAAAAGRGDRARDRAACSCCSALFRMGWIASFLSKAVVDRVPGGGGRRRRHRRACPSSPAPPPRATTPWRELGLVAPGRSATTTVRRCSSAPSRSPWSSRCACSPRRCRVRSCSSSGGLLASALFDLGGRWRRARRRRTASGCPAPRGARASHSSATSYVTIVVAAVALLLIGFSADRRRRTDVRRPATATGSTSTRSPSPRGWRTSAPACLQGMPVSTSLSASSLNESSGATHADRIVVTGGLVARDALVLAPLFSHLPQGRARRRRSSTRSSSA